MPRTPPATWTPEQPPATATPQPTRPTPAWTILPTATPRASTPRPSTPQPTAPLEPTAAAPTPTPSPSPTARSNTPLPTASAQATPSRSTSTSQLALWLYAEPVLVEPGTLVEIRIDLGNLTATTVQDPIVELPAVAHLRYQEVREVVGAVTLTADHVVWQPGSLPAHSGGALVVTARVDADILPDVALPLSAHVTWSGGELWTAETALSTPPALLPAAGSSTF